MTVTLDEATEEIINSRIEDGVFETPAQAVAFAVQFLTERDEVDWLLQNSEFVRNALAKSFEAEANGDSHSPEDVERMLVEKREKRRPTLL